MAPVGTIQTRILYVVPTSHNTAFSHLYNPGTLYRNPAPAQERCYSECVRHITAESKQWTTLQWIAESTLPNRNAALHVIPRPTPLPFVGGPPESLVAQGGEGMGIIDGWSCTATPSHSRPTILPGRPVLALARRAVLPAAVQQQYSGLLVSKANYEGYKTYRFLQSTIH